MNKREKAIKETVAYLKSHNIRFEISFEDGTICVVTELKAHDAPNHRVEASVYFFSECMEVRAYYIPHYAQRSSEEAVISTI